MTTTLVASSFHSLQAVPADTVVTVAARSGLEVAADVAVVALTVVLALLVLVLLVQLRKVHGTVRSLGDSLLEKADPAIQSARGVGENVEFITGVVREDIQKVHRSVGEITERLNQASDRVEERIEEFNALMEVVQEEAEDIFIGTASTVRGVRAGAHSLQEPDAREEEEEKEKEGKPPAASPDGRRAMREDPSPPPGPPGAAVPSSAKAGPDIEEE